MHLSSTFSWKVFVVEASTFVNPKAPKSGKIMLTPLDLPLVDHPRASKAHPIVTKFTPGFRGVSFNYQYNILYCSTFI